MIKLPINKLWVCLPSEANLEIISKYPMYRATDDHCLVIADEKPKCCCEMNERRIRKLDSDDWKWIYSQSDRMRREREEKYHKELVTAQEQFFSKFERALEEERREQNNGEKETGTEHSGET